MKRSLLPALMLLATAGLASAGGLAAADGPNDTMEVAPTQVRLGEAWGRALQSGELSSEVAPRAARKKSPRCGDKVLRKADGTKWKCTFADDFDGKRLNPKKWLAVSTNDTGFRIRDDCYQTGPENINVADGRLSLTVRTTLLPFLCTPPRELPYLTDVTAASVTTHGRFAQTRGRYEARIKFPKVTTAGLHSAFWLTPLEPSRYGSWPLSGELDIAEFYTRYPDRLIPFIHYAPETIKTDVTNNHCMVKTPWKWHTYRLEWTQKRFVIRYDKKKCLAMSWRSGPYTTAPAPFDVPFVVNLTQGLGLGVNDYRAGVTTMPGSLQVDYVRVWK